MFDGVSDAALLAVVGLFGGIILGLAARLGRFCTLGAIEDALYQGSAIRLRMWGLAIAVAALASQGLTSFGMLDYEATLYHATPFSPTLAVLGGLCFGYGMALAGNCGFGALARLGGGDLRSFVIVLVMGISAYVAISGPLAALRLAAIDATQVADGTTTFPILFERMAGVPAEATGAVLAAALFVAAIASRRFLADRRAVLWGVAVGAAIVSGWVGSQWIATNGFLGNLVVSHSFTMPLGETLLYLMTASGGGLSFGVGSVLGVLAGAFIGSLVKGHFRWEACEDPRELKRQVVGAALMGVGAVLAVGCTVGQGLSAFSLLTVSAPIVFASIFLGAGLGLRQLITGRLLPTI